LQKLCRLGILLYFVWKSEPEAMVENVQANSPAGGFSPITEFPTISPREQGRNKPPSNSINGVLRDLTGSHTIGADQIPSTYKRPEAVHIPQCEAPK